MSRYDGLIIPRSYSDYINKTDAATLLQALQQSGVMDAAPTSGSNHPVKSDGINKIVTKNDANLCTPGENKVSFFSVFGSNTPNTTDRFYITAFNNGQKITQIAQTTPRGTSSAFGLYSDLYTRSGIYKNGGITWENWGKLAKIKKIEVTGTTSANGNLQVGIGGEKSIVTAVQTSNSEGFNNDAIAIPYKLGDGKPVGDANGRWGVHCISSNPSNTVLANTTMYLTVFYSEI